MLWTRDTPFKQAVKISQGLLSTYKYWRAAKTEAAGEVDERYTDTLLLNLNGSRALLPLLILTQVIKNIDDGKKHTET